MFMLAGLLGLFAVGAVAFVGVEDIDEAEDDDLIQSENEQSGAGDVAKMPLSALLPTQEADGAEADAPPVSEASAAGASIPAETTGPIQGTRGDDILEGTQGDDLIVGLKGDDQINGYEDDDTIRGGRGADRLFGAEGEDTLRGGKGEDLLHGEAGDDSLSGSGGADTLFGHEGDDILSGNRHDDTLHGGSGIDTLKGGAGDDALHGGLDNDVLIGGKGEDALFGGYGDDMLSGVKLEQQPDGMADTDRSDFLNGGDGDDTILAGNDDIVTSGEGEDTVVLGDWIAKDKPVEITDFDAGEDSLVVVVEDDSFDEAEITVEIDTSDPGMSSVMLNGVEIARVDSDTGLKAGNINLINSTGAGTLTPLL